MKNIEEIKINLNNSIKALMITIGSMKRIVEIMQQGNATVDKHMKKNIPTLTVVKK